LSTPLRLQIPRQLYDAMISHAVRELPNECCGLLAGHPDRGAILVRHYPLVNAAASPVEYLSDARSMFDAVRDMRRLELEILAIYHSHPTSDPVPSRTDLERNYSPDVLNLIISLKQAEPVVRGWWLTPEGYHEAHWEVS
jgi:proteasome lid subunit RPN8/RPN11